jgi:hypothetical protein
MKITDKELEAILKLSPFDRYKHFIKRVADSEKMYMLVDKEGNWALADVEGKDVFSVWSAPEYARLSAFGEWADFTVDSITMKQFENDIVDKIDKNGYLINVFSIKGKSGFIVDLDEFTRDLNDEISKYD